MPEEKDPKTERRPRWGQARPLVWSAVAALVLVVAAMLWHLHADSVNSVPPAGAPGPGADAADTSFAAQGVAMLELDAFDGRLTITVGDAAQVTLTSSGVAANALGPRFRLNAATHTLVLACAARTAPAAAAPVPAACPAADYDVSVPAGMGVSLDERSGQASLIGLSGPVSITATSADTTARDLRTAQFTAAVTSGTLDVGFADAPEHTLVSVTSAHATLRLPGSVGYDITQQAVSADIEVGVPESTASRYDVRAVATSGEISLLTS